jgi:hypothetical protein
MVLSTPMDQPYEVVVSTATEEYAKAQEKFTEKYEEVIERVNAELPQGAQLDVLEKSDFNNPESRTDADVAYYSAVKEQLEGLSPRSATSHLWKEDLKTAAKYLILADQLIEGDEVDLELFEQYGEVESATAFINSTRHLL